MKTNRIILIMISATVLLACGKQEDTETVFSPKPVPVKLEKVEKKELSIPIETQGRLAASQESQLSFKVAGIIKHIYVDEGYNVRKGQVLATLDMAEISAQVNRAKAAYEKAKRDLNRMKNLFKDKVITLEVLQNAETAFDVAKSDLEIATFNKQFATIKAPSNGQILTRKAEENELINPGAPVFDFANTKQSWVIKVGLVDREVVKIQQGDSAVVLFDAFPGHISTARVTLIPNAPNPINGTYEVELSVQDANNKLKNGFYGKVKIFPSLRQSYQLIPLQALVEGNGRNGFVFSAKGTKVIKHQVEIEEFFGPYLAISTESNALENIISEGVDQLTEKSEVEIISD
ncbi:efflux RND transporter periplasmic adaptor subunit [Fulvivirgaceae bacterium BMA10]|uniref:Efflux RND transporter periplasmic adaptor subunit n=1 Tax=Splendidivirga corallicola TaxID=3051826 RepID=A0ABT8KJ71_9BACT|nr:efflux RND transporter periplasmic adaptor subunit [Fulvivirgaceae bacterium BMA10]